MVLCAPKGEIGKGYVLFLYTGKINTAESQKPKA